MHESHVRVRYSETDQMGIAHHANYFLWLEVARTDYLAALGYRYKELEARGIRLAVVHVECRYLVPARYDDLLKVRTWVTELRRLKLDFEYEIILEDGSVGATARTVLACLDRNGRPQPLPDDVAQRIQMAQAGDIT